MAIVKFLMQGLEEKDNHLNNLIELINFKDAEKIILSTAFLTSNGVFLLKEELRGNKEKISIYVGCRNGITSKQGIMGLLELGISPYVVDTGSPRFIFHPKAFIAISPVGALSTVGSANLTYGGLLNNLESSNLLILDLADENDKLYIENFTYVFDVLRNQFAENVIRVKTVKMVEALFDEGKLIDENKVSEVVNVGRNSEGENVVPIMRLKREKVSLPLKLRQKKNKARIVAKSVTETDEGPMVIFNDKGLELLEVWKSKELTERDLNVPSGTTTNVTGSMLLKKGKYNVDQQVYFRNEVFEKLVWTSKEVKPDYFHYAKAQFYFIIEGINYGIYELELKHDMRTDTRTYEQRQPMTHLLWGNAKKLIANPNLLDKEMTLYEVVGTSNEFVIDIQSK